MNQASARLLPAGSVLLLDELIDGGEPVADAAA
jgi:hypothetical protein